GRNVWPSVAHPRPAPDTICVEVTFLANLDSTTRLTYSRISRAGFITLTAGKRPATGDHKGSFWREYSDARGTTERNRNIRKEDSEIGGGAQARQGKHSTGGDPQ